jgi:uncharacterized protein YaiL (DUF2058 family)
MISEFTLLVYSSAMQIVLSALLTLASFAQQQDVQQDAEIVLADAYKQAAEENKNVFIELRADW